MRARWKNRRKQHRCGTPRMGQLAQIMYRHQIAARAIGQIRPPAPGLRLAAGQHNKVTPRPRQPRQLIKSGAALALVQVIVAVHQSAAAR